jgi:hypothetical protein
MSKRILAGVALLALFAAPLAAQEMKAGQPGDERTITGQVIDVNCYVGMGASGAGHKACAEACAKAGVQLAILGTDGTIYAAVSSKPMDAQNTKLLPHAEGKVKVTGTHRLKNGLHTIEVKTIEAAT